MLLRTFRASSLGLIASLAMAIMVTTSPVATANELPSIDDWIVLDVEGFRAIFPGTPDHGLEITQTILGSVKASRYVYETATEHFAVERHELPRLSRMLATASLILEKTRDGILSDREADEISFEETESAGHPMRVLRYRSKDGRSPVELTHIYLVDRDIYLVTAESGKSEQAQSIARRFFDSFELLAHD